MPRRPARSHTFAVRLPCVCHAFAMRLPRVCLPCVCHGVCHAFQIFNCQIATHPPQVPRRTRRRCLDALRDNRKNGSWVTRQRRAPAAGASTPCVRDDSVLQYLVYLGLVTVGGKYLAATVGCAVATLWEFIGCGEQAQLLLPPASLHSACIRRLSRAPGPQAVSASLCCNAAGHPRPPAARR